jgi:two-component system, NarL family, sensor histidine kinase DesK
MPGRKVQAGWLTGQVPGTDGIAARATAGQERAAPSLSAAYEVHGGQRLARLILLTVLCGFLSVQLIDLLDSPIQSHGLKLTVGVASICVVFALQVYISSSTSEAWSMRRRLALLAAQAIVTYLPLVILGGQWAGMAGFFAGSVLLLVPGLIAWALFGCVILSMLIGPIVLGLNAYTVAYLTVASLDIGLIVFGLSRLTLVIRYVHASRAELAQLAVVRERMRFARDLHDLLGYSLSAITLKAELTRRLVGVNPERARDELADLLDVSRQALADVRMVASGYRNMSLSKEAASVVSLLATAGITAQVEINCGALDEDIDTVLATVLREAVTNMLRHSTAQNCTVEANVSGDAATLRVTNDGVPGPSALRRDGGGLDNLASRLEAVGGSLTTRVGDDGRFDVLATVPMPAETGPTSIRPSSTGPSSTGPSSTGPAETGPSSTGPAETGPLEGGVSDTKPADGDPADLTGRACGEAS